MENPSPQRSQVTAAAFPSENFVVGGGVAIFHIASKRVVICSQKVQIAGKVETIYFLPKGRRDAGEESGRGAEREGYEESGYRNRILPLPILHRQPQAHPRTAAQPLTAEPVWLELLPMRRNTIQYLLYWYIAETLPPSLEAELETVAGEAYKPPPPFPKDLTLHERVRMEGEGYEPVHHEGTGVDEEEMSYESHLVSVEEAVERLADEVMSDVVRRGWGGIQERWAAEEEAMRATK